MKITVTRDDGTKQDITSLVQIAFDVATHSMDWGSGFLDVEETDGLILLAAACGFPALEEILQEQWRDRMVADKAWDEKERLALERGETHWRGIKPTAGEQAEFLDNLKREYTP